MNEEKMMRIFMLLAAAILAELVEAAAGFIIVLSFKYIA